MSNQQSVLIILVIITANAIAVAVILNVVFIILAAREIRKSRNNRMNEGRQTEIDFEKER